MDPQLVTLLLGLFGGAGATLLWELFLRPARGKRAIAEVLAAELSINIQILGGAQHYANPKKVPPDISFPTMVFDSIVDRIGELPPKLVGEVVFLYAYLKELNEHPQIFVDCVKELRGYRQDSQQYQQVERELLACVRVFNSYVEKALRRMGIVQPLLLKAAFPWWSPRRFRRNKPITLDAEELAQKIAKSESDRDALANAIQARHQDRPK